MKTSRHVVSLVGAVGLAGLLVACGSEVPSLSASASGSGSGSASASGTVTGFGSVFINGKKYEANNVAVKLDDDSERSCSINPSDSCGLKKGMVVTVNGSFNETQHSAASVRQKDVVEGVVQSVAPDGLSLIVMGQTVLVDETTIVDNNIAGQNVRNLVVGTDAVEVNGHIRPNGVIQATFIEKKPVGTVTPEVHGYVSSHNDGANTFTIGGLTVNYATALINDMPAPSGNNWNGLFVEAKGTVFNATTTTLSATKIEPDGPGLGNNIDQFEVEGFVTEVLRPGDFFIGTTRVQTTSATEFRGGTIDEVVLGAKLSAEGRVTSGTLTTKHVKFHASARLEGDIASISGNSCTVVGLPGITVQVTSQTEFKDTSLGGLSTGDHVRVRGRVSGGDSIVATRVELQSGDNDVDLQGPVQSISGNVIVIFGLPVDTGTITQFESVSGSSMSRAGFLAAVNVNSLVKVKGTLNGSTVKWDEAELED
ncbi:MAG TPA: DUF5666 domain-containing protein [Nitrospira sp.]|nr:DUF5666 domain-containing protein [Nitrospira sp.]